jgi:hypothetical protein
VAISNLKIEMMLFFVSRVNQQMVFKKVKKNECKKDKEWCPGRHLHRFRKDVENSNTEEDPRRERHQDCRITTAPILTNKDHRHAGERCGSREASGKQDLPPLTRHQYFSLGESDAAV